MLPLATSLEERYELDLPNEAVIQAGALHAIAQILYHNFSIPMPIKPPLPAPSNLEAEFNKNA